MIDSSVSGFIDVKVPSKGKRFGPWKSWRNQWCVLKRIGSRLEIQLSSYKGHISSNIVLPNDAVIYRSESRSRPYAFGIFYPSRVSCEACIFLSGQSETESQKWMANIRECLRPSIRQPLEGEFSVSLIDNDHSRAAGLAGLYGILSVEPTEIIIKDPRTLEVEVRWPLNMFYSSYIMSPANSEDFNRVCVLQTGSSFKSGIGNLKLFCLAATEFHESLTTCQRNRIHRRLMQTPLPPAPPQIETPPPAPPALLATRRMSRSEGDLQLFLFQHTLPKQAFLRISQDDLASKKNGNSILFTSVGLVMTTPGSSIPGSNVNLAQCVVPAPHFLVHKLENLDTAQRNMQPEIDERSEQDTYELARRTSEVSVNSETSGMYEEIDEKPALPPTNPISIITPPPLPPRSPLPKINKESPKEATGEKESEYVPMSIKSQSTPDFAQEYMVMAGVKHKSKLIVSNPVPI